MLGLCKSHLWLALAGTLVAGRVVPQKLPVNFGVRQRTCKTPDD
jgi:hypothetical protein